MNAPIQRFCPGKINVALGVGPPCAQRANMHPIASWMLAVRLGDRLTIAPSSDSQSRFTIAFSGDCPRSQQVDWPIEKDLGYRAHQLLQQQTGRSLPIDLTLRKSLPAGAGMGGGSSNAAHVLMAVNDLFELGLDDAHLMTLGGRLGSDVPFFILAHRGHSSALVSGFGDAIQALAPLAKPLHLLLMFPAFGCPTGPVYQAFDRLNPPGSISHRPETDRVKSLAALDRLPPEGPFNDLAEPAFQVAPQLGHLRDLAQKATGLAVHVTGSGSTLFAMASSDSHGLELADRLQGISGLTCRLTRSL